MCVQRVASHSVCDQSCTGMKTGIHLAESENDTITVRSQKSGCQSRKASFFALLSESTAQPDIGVSQVAA
jgi:hypothetical protein